MATSNAKVIIDEADALLAAIRGSVLVHVQDGVLPSHLKVPLDSAHLLNECAAEIDDEDVRAAADALEAWLMMLAAETDPISHTRTRSLLDQISELEVALIACRARANVATLDVGNFVDESFESLQVNRAPAVRAVNVEAPRESISDIDSEILDVFGEEAESLLESIRANLDTLAGQPGDRDALWEIKKSSHTLKGAAGVMGLKELSRLAHRVEDLLESLSTSEANFDLDIYALLLATTGCMKSLADGNPSAAETQTTETLHKRFDDAMVRVSNPQSADFTPSLEESVPNAAPAGPEPNVPATPRRTSSIVRVSLDKLDDLVRDIRDLVTARSAFERGFHDFERQLDETTNNTLRLQAASQKVDHLQACSLQELHQSAYELSETARDAVVIKTALDNVRTNLETLFGEQYSLIGEIKSRLMRLRNVEFGTIANRLQRTVRVTCDEEGKHADVVIENGSLEIDTQVIDALIEPLLHLLKNAVVHGIEPPETRRMLGKPEVGKITVRVSNKGAYIVLSVTDDGRGIAFRPLLEKAVASNLISRAEAEEMTNDKIRELIFLPGLTTAQKLSLNAGRGVGMSIVRESVAARGGIVLIETWPQKGTTFSIRIPRPFADDDSAEEVLGTYLRPTAKRRTVLVVDDSPSVRLMTANLIEKEGWAAETARDGIEALEKLRDMPTPAVILSDIEMPRMGGYEFVGALREDDSLKDIPVIFISSRTTDREQARAAGVADYLTKPYIEKDLLETIDRLASTPELVAT